MSVILKIYLQNAEEPFKEEKREDLNEAEIRIKEILRDGFYRTNEKSRIKTYYPLHRIVEFKTEEKEE